MKVSICEGSRLWVFWVSQSRDPHFGNCGPGSRGKEALALLSAWVG